MKNFLRLSFFFSFLFPTFSFAFIEGAPWKSEAYYKRQDTPEYDATCTRIKTRYDKALNDASKAMVDVYTSYSNLYAAKEDLSKATKDISTAIDEAITNVCLEKSGTCTTALEALQKAYYNPDANGDTLISISTLSLRMTKNATDAEARNDKFKVAIDTALATANEVKEECN